MRTLRPLTCGLLLGALFFSAPASLGLYAGPSGVLQDPEDDEDRDEVTEVSIERLTSIEWKPGEELPDDIKELDGKRIKITGYMAVGTLEGANSFELVPESCECGRSKVHHFVSVSIKDGGATYTPARVELEGVFSASEVEEDGFVTSLYRLEIDTFDV